MFKTSSVYIMIKPHVEVPKPVYEEFAKDNSIIEEGYDGLFVHFQGVVWESAFNNVLMIEDFLARQSRNDFMFIRVSSMEDIETSGGWSSHPFRHYLPYNLVEHLDAFI